MAKIAKEKNQAELEIEALAEVFGIATTGFEKFYEETKEKAKGNSSTAASSGYSSKAASSGNYSTAASSGNSSTAASSGYSSKAASSGNYSTAASSGNYSTAASSGYSSKAASSGYSSTAASSGDSSTAASSGYYSTAASSGDSSTAASSGYSSKAASSGDSSKAASSGNYSACSALGYRAAVKGDKGNLLMASEYIIKDGNYIPVGGKADLVDGKKLKANCWYIVEVGEWVEVDFTDNVFSRVISNKSGIKKVKTEDCKILYIVSDENGNSSHGSTIKQAREDLSFKNSKKNADEWKGLPLTTVKTPIEWAGVYRDCTGACTAGIKQFIASKGKTKKQYTLEEIMAETKGAYGYDQFVKVVGGAE